MERLEKNQLHQTEITGYTAEGLGVGRVGGQVVFVHGGVRGEVCTVRILKTLKNIAYARVEAVETPSPARQMPDCPYFPACGGCQFRHITYEEELWAKRRRVEDALGRLGGAEVAVEEILGSREILRYRNKSQFPVGPDGRPGFYRARSHQVIPVADCLLQTTAANAAAGAVAAWAAASGAAPYDEKTGRGLLRHIYVRTNRAGEALICLVANGGALPEEEELVRAVRAACPGTVGILLNENTRSTNVILGERYRTLWGAERLEDTLRGLRFTLSVPSFYQVNRPQAERLYEKALEFAALTGRELVLDLYCGIGTITLCLAGRAGRVIGAEIVPEAIRDARENARRNGIENAEFFCGDAGETAAHLAAEGLRPDVVVVDPPRKGLGEGVVETIASMGPQRVVYVSCDPATLGRDVKRFAAQGYAARRAAAVDLFPRTAHVESVVLLERQTEKMGDMMDNKEKISRIWVPKYNKFCYQVEIAPDLREKALAFSREIITTDNQYSRLLPQEVREGGSLSAQQAVEIQRTAIGKLGEAAFATLLRRLGKNVELGDMFEIMEGQSNVDSYDFRTLQNRTVDVKTGFRSFHTRLLVNTEQFDGTPKDYYVAVKFETQEVDSRRKLVNYLDITDGLVVGWAEYGYMERFAPVEDFGEGPARWLFYKKLLPIDRLLKEF